MHYSAVLNWRASGMFQTRGTADHVVWSGGRGKPARVGGVSSSCSCPSSSRPELELSSLLLKLSKM